MRTRIAGGLFVSHLWSETDLKSHNVTACIHKHVKANPEEFMEAMNGKLSLEDRFLLDKSLEEYQWYQNLMNKLTSEIIAYIEKEFP